MAFVGRKYNVLEKIPTRKEITQHEQIVDGRMIRGIKFRRLWEPFARNKERRMNIQDSLFR